MNSRTEAFQKKFTSASRHLGVRPTQIVSLKLRENVSSYAEYREFLRVLEREAGIQWSTADGELQGQGYLVFDGNVRVIIVEHETGLEILYVAGSIASVIGLVPLILKGWYALRGRFSGRRSMDDRGIEIRRLDDKGNLSEDSSHATIALGALPFSVDSAIVSAAKDIEADLRRITGEMQLLTGRVDALENEMKTKKSKSTTRKRGVRKGISRP